MVELTIESLGARGDGIAHDGAGAIYVPHSAPGDRVAATLTGKRGNERLARLDAVLRPGPDRVEPPCRHFGICGGCAMQHLNGRAYKDWKLNILCQALARRGLGGTAIEEMITIPAANRRRARFAALRMRNGVQLGFNEPGSHKIINLTECHILRPAIIDLLDGLRGLLTDLLAQNKRTYIQVTETETGLDLWLLADLPHDAQTDMRLADFAQEVDLARLSTGKRPEVVIVRRAPRVTFTGVAVTPPPDGFLQASQAGEAALVRLVQDGVADAANVADLFAGVGTFSFALGRSTKVKAVEGADDQAGALIAARNAARRSGIEVEVRDLERRALSVEELSTFDAAIFDPPRAGAARQVYNLAVSTVPRIVAVSCNQATFARDSATLADAGYQLQSVTPVDQFPWSRHLELVAVLQR